MSYHITSNVLYFAVALPTLPFGDPLGDHFGPFGPDAVSGAIPLQGKYMFYGHEENTLFVSGKTCTRFTKVTMSM